ncbi:OmpA family protein [Thiothrix lacustris]|uniref:OmpA family protein n=1 Tax=Thiothrix lacustris TaxID=525917 RepID=UPI0027E47791|nr:OmpA family protein [Thiothrix lacustris]WMP18157.1 OmpA family protein [Thiothrix lacustris]
MKAKSLIVLLLAGIWGVGSWWWYTCKVKGFCGTDNTTSAQIAEGTPVTGADLNTSANPIDTDGDGVPDTKEAMLGLDPTKEDSDGDGISDFIELARDPQDTDGDGKIDAIDDDDDNDGILTSAENPDPNGDGNVDDALDSNNNQLADYLDPSTTPSTTDTADADKAKAEAEKADADKAKAEAEKADADKAKAEAEKADADKAKAEAEAEKADADKAKTEAEKADADKVTLETDNATQGSDIGPATLTFPTGSANPKLAATTQAYFDKLAAFLKDNSSAKVTIVGHTDSQGDPAKNKVLGLQRAEMLQKILIDIGAPKNRVTASSQGADKPIADNKTEEGRKKNRRVEITPIK